MSTQKEMSIQLNVVAKETVVELLQQGHMIALFSKTELLYIIFSKRAYECFLHPIGELSGRHKSFPDNEKNASVIKNMIELADEAFDIVYHKEMDLVSVMVNAEQGILEFLEMSGKLPDTDIDFMEHIDKNSQ